MLKAIEQAANTTAGRCVSCGVAASSMAAVMTLGMVGVFDLFLFVKPQHRRFVGHQFTLSLTF